MFPYDPQQTTQEDPPESKPFGETEQSETVEKERPETEPENKTAGEQHVGDFDGDVNKFNNRPGPTDDDGNETGEAVFRSATGHNDEES